MATSTPSPTLEQRVLALEQEIIPLAAGQVKGKLSTRAAGFLTALATGLGYVISSQLLTPDETSIVTLVVAGLSAFLTAEET